MDQEPASQIQIPEKEANELARRLRNHRLLHGVALSVYAYVSRAGVRALHVAIDYEDHRYDIRYKADTDMEKLVGNAMKRIRTQFEL